MLFLTAEDFSIWIRKNVIDVSRHVRKCRHCRPIGQQWQRSRRRGWPAATVWHQVHRGAIHPERPVETDKSHRYGWDRRERHFHGQRFGKTAQGNAQKWTARSIRYVKNINGAGAFLSDHTRMKIVLWFFSRNLLEQNWRHYPSLGRESRWRDRVQSVPWNGPAVPTVHGASFHTHKHCQSLCLCRRVLLQVRTFTVVGNKWSRKYPWNHCRSWASRLI